ncbi:hypothetical protein BX616_001309 [Lobosporangium transversale]|uniref:RRM domain-containing protein n=1 Tax=Lobosporangium transversale TaxID=64571 RepID=A0A1Y2GFZ7_9FUNG|nr:hypothetical protein BCR41DRAFT_325451 [Lobosporangium transversale]KAF9904408.1 hypothetical protein BX616_001309 [Lobosporangium transversale]ORZ09729.1 hypothetical protein BCR41DRAFT_325451 [Lobosporangium transversale]|eukprot:XP_021878999.1 hypothetical protein BCR41DRAFT_325451 [Lobosporangium transversale]
MADTEMTEATPITTAPASVTEQSQQPGPTENTPASNPSLYIKNLNEKIKLDVLKKSLKTIFGQYGEVLNIVAHSNIRMRGQAFVIFENEDAATKALSEVQSFPLYGKPMVIQFAKTKSDIHAKRDGNYEEHYKQRMARKEKFANEFKPRRRQAMLLAKQQQKALEQQRILEEQQQLLLQQQMVQQAQYAQQHGGVLPGAAAGAVPMIPDEYLPRNSILFLQNLPHDIAESQLVSLFQQYPGFKEVRTVPGKSGIAFVEYDNEYYSAAAKTALADYQIDPEHKMKVTFARK